MSIDNALPWWKQGVIYQIYPKSFQATGDKSTGDLKGVIRRLDYLQQLGVSAIWLTPVYPSPQVDNGYDVADYCAIDPVYGTMQDFDELVTKAHQKGIRIMMDMVFNHTSTAHLWFQSALDKNSPYRTFYIWKEGKAQGQPPTRWQSKFGGSAWQWHAESGQYYLHLFSAQQADLNWDNPAVRHELQQVCEFWAKKGVDALRLDVINLISKDPTFPEDICGDGRRYYTDGPRVDEFLTSLSEQVFQPYQLATVGEMSSTTLAHCQRYAAISGKALSMTFNFHHLKIDYPNGEKWSVAEPNFLLLKQITHQWQTGMYQIAWNALFWGNHDQPRVVSRLGDDTNYRVVSAKMLAMLQFGLQGTPYIYQGEEIGMTNPHFTSILDYRDIESLNMYAEKKANGMSEADILAILAQKSRDNSRTPMQWDGTDNAGFTQGTPWIALADSHADIHVEQALADPNSIFYCYQTLITLRYRYTVFTAGNYVDLLPDSETCWIYSRTSNSERLVVIANLIGQIQQVTLPAECFATSYDILLSNYSSDETTMSETLTLRPYEARYLYLSSSDKTR